MAIDSLELMELLVTIEEEFDITLDDAQLKKIMTKEQYDSYVKKQAEREKQMKEGRQNRQKRQG